ncbi:fimbrial protein, partial [Escherichia coli]
MKKLKGFIFLLLVTEGFSHAAVQKTVFSADVVASACHVVVEADSSGNSGRLTFGTYRRST